MQDSWLTRRKYLLMLRPEPVDAEVDDVTGPKPHGGIESHAHSRGCPRVDEIARLEDHELAEIVHDEIRIEDHLLG